LHSYHILGYPLLVQPIAIGIRNCDPESSGNAVVEHSYRSIVLGYIHAIQAKWNAVYIHAVGIREGDRVLYRRFIQVHLLMEQVGVLPSKSAGFEKSNITHAALVLATWGNAVAYQVPNSTAS
jgi:hypothetical protein